MLLCYKLPVKIFIYFSCIFFSASKIHSQELFVATEPASDMPSHSFGLRLNNFFMPPYSNKATGIDNNVSMYRFNTELMWGFNRYFMGHLNLYASNMHQSNFKFEGAGVYLKYRFLSLDQVQSHFRVAAYGKVALINNALQYNDINLNGDNSGYTAGLVATQLIHKLAISFTGGYIYGLDNFKYKFLNNQSRGVFNCSFSSGYLLLPFKYKNFNQTNFNLYVEMLGKYNAQTSEQFLDIFPAIQFIIKSTMRLDLGYRKQLSGNMARINNQEFMLRFEYNIFSAY
jgi:hypothetical protein